MKIFIGIDNGITGSIGYITSEGQFGYYETPIKNELSYTKKKQNISRIDFSRFKILLESIFSKFNEYSILVILERPMINPMRFNASLSAIRALESTLICLEELKYPYQYIDSKEWQKKLLPEGIKAEELKKASLDIGKRLFPNIKFNKDADSLLIAEYGRKFL